MNLKIPKYHKEDIHNWVDFLELKCLVSITGELSEGDIEDCFDLPLSDYGEGFFPEEEVRDFERSKKPSNERYINFYMSIREQIDWRANFFDDFYPFIWESSVLKRRDELTPSNLLYVFLLLCSSLNNVTKSDVAHLTADFESLAKTWLIMQFPKFKTILIGKGRNQNKNLPNKILEKFKDISQMIGERLNPDFTEENVSKYNTGDGGIDTLTYNETDDELGNRLLIFGQCKCSPDWIKEIGVFGQSIEEVFNLRASSIKVFIVPFSHRKSDGNWFRPQVLYNISLIDRYRLMKGISNISLRRFLSGESLNLVEKFLSSKEDIL